MHPEINRKLRGHRFYPTAAELAKHPKTYEQDGMGKQAIVHVHYFGAVGDWWVTEFSPDFAEDGEAFGYVKLAGHQTGEFTYIYLPGLEERNERATRGLPVPLYVERDCYWTPKTVQECIDARG